MSFIDKLQEIERLQQTIEKHGKIAADTLRKINYKFRLDWNYYSNVIEGNSLTMQETRSIMIGNITVDGKPIKDVMEMKGHDDVINDILKIGKSELNLSEKRIKDIHKGIMHEEDTEKASMIGKWKTDPNYLYNYKKERFDFTAPADVPEAMHKLINWLNTEKEKIARKAEDALHPIQLAFHFHIDYVTIHPFYDGNGRTARIFTNLILISYGYPPVYVKDTEKETYNQYLGEIQTYGGDTELFYEFMAGLLIRSEQLVIDAIEGRMIDEPNDWQKKIKLLKLEKGNNDLKVTKDEVSLKNVIDNVIFSLLEKVIISLNDFDELFNHKLITIGSTSIKKDFSLKTSEELGWTLKKFRKSNLSDFDEDDQYDYYYIDDLIFNYYQSGFKRDGINTFSVKLILTWTFDYYKYSLTTNLNQSKRISTKLYHENYSEEEAQEIINIIGNDLYQQIESKIKTQKPE